MPWLGLDQATTADNNNALDFYSTFHLRIAKRFTNISEPLQSPGKLGWYHHPPRAADVDNEESAEKSLALDHIFSQWRSWN